MILFTITSCGSNSTKSKSSSDEDPVRDLTKTYANDQFSIAYPSTWKEKSGGPNGIAISFLSPKETPLDNFKENVNIIVQDLSGQSMDLEMYAELSESGIKSLINKGKIIESTRVHAEGKAAFHKIIYTADANGFHLKFEQYYFVQAEKAFVVTLTCEEKRFDAFRKIGEKILDSFVVKLSE